MSRFELNKHFKHCFLRKGARLYITLFLIPLCNYWFIYIAKPYVSRWTMFKVFVQFKMFYSLESQQLPNFTNRCRTPCTPMPPHEAATTGREDSHPILPTCCVYHSTNDGRYCNSLLRHLPAHSYTSLSCCKGTKKILNYASKLAIIYQA